MQQVLAGFGVTPEDIKAVLEVRHRQWVARGHFLHAEAAALHRVPPCCRRWASTCCKG